MHNNGWFKGRLFYWTNNLENLKVFLPGILRDKTINDKLKYISNDDKQNYPSGD